jgi:CubicO group peptidase (beta-lactamase class C family)
VRVTPHRTAAPPKSAKASAATAINRRRFTQSLGGLVVAQLCPRRLTALTSEAGRNTITVDESRELKSVALAVSAILGSHLKAGYTAGAVAIIARGDHAEFVVVGDKSNELTDPLRIGSIFRISSMTKPITAAATLMLVEEGRLHLDEPVDAWLPELARRRVLKDISSPLDDTVWAKRAITVEDLLTFRCGLGILLAPPDTYPIQRQIAALHLPGFGPPEPASPLTGDEWMRRLGTLPLMAQPGEEWLYNTGSAILGVLLERASGSSFPQLLRKRIFEPLGMKDTGFFVPETQRNRLVSAYRLEAGRLQLYDAPDKSAWTSAPAFPDGGAGLVSTADDYLAFSRLVLGRGRFAGRRLLTEASVAAMTRDHLTADQRARGAAILGSGRGWGYGLSVVAEKSAAGLPPGAVGWNGGLGTTWVADPRSGLTAILLTQTMFTSPEVPAMHQEFWHAVFSPDLL